MKNLALLFCFAACGRDECADYVKTYCGKIALCDPAIWQPTCEQGTLDAIHAQHLSQEQCHAANDKIGPMGCASFNAFLQTTLNSR